VTNTPLAAQGSLAWRLLPDGRLLTVIHLAFGRARLTIGPANDFWHDDGW
jgi:hypothetical protein